MEDFDYCTTCLVTNVKMYSLNSPISTTTTTREVFLEFLRIPIGSCMKDMLKFCFECAGHIYKFEKFTSKCHRAQDVLSRLWQDNCKLTKTDLQNVNREQHKLTSTMTLISTKCISVVDIAIKNHIPSSSEDKLGAYDIIQDIDGNINHPVDIKLIKSEQDIEDSLLQEYETDFNEENNYNVNEKSTKVNSKQRRTKSSKKDHKSKKRKKQNNISGTKDVFEPVSDDEPLANKVSETIKKDPKTNGVLKKSIRKNFNIGYFEDYATVVFLTPDEAKRELLLRKESSNYTNSPFKCQFCFRGYEAKGAFENHMKKHSSDYGDFECDICHLRFPEQRCLCKHRLASHKRKFCCKLCSYVCFCTHQAKTHVSFHKGKKYPCKECKEIFSMPNSLLMHKRLKHVTECVCELCGDTFATPRGLYSHNKKVHRQENNEKLGPKCEECGIHFATEEAWKRHLVMSSKHNVSNGCKTCGETFPNAEELKRHMRVHARKHAGRTDGVKLPAACVICDIYLLNRTEYKAHMTSSHPHSEITRKLDAEELTPFVCEQCGLAFKKQCFLTYHQRKHTGERPYKCIQCNKTFQLAGALSTHKAIHLRRAHKCRVCDRVFTFKSALNKHMKVHLNIRPHRCDICDKSFISPCDVRLHIKYVHNKVPWPKRDRTKRSQEPNLMQH